MRILHIVPGTDNVANGMVIAACLLAKEQGDAEVVDLKNTDSGKVAAADEVWVHGMWLPREWKACRWALKAGKPFVRMTHGSLSPMYLKHKGKWRKELVGPIERFFLRKASRIIATCEEEKGWIQSYLGRRCPPVEVTDFRRFFKLQVTGNGKVGKQVRPDFPLGKAARPLHLLYLGRCHPLKGLEYLISAIHQLDPNFKCEIDKTYFAILQSRSRNLHLPAMALAAADSPSIQLKVVSNAFGEEKEKVWEWCDVLVFPTLSENFGLVIAEALERGKHVITTDGAPAWGDGNDYGGRLTYLNGYLNSSREERILLLENAIVRLHAERGNECVSG